jgi:hypothetical protein
MRHEKFLRVVCLTYDGRYSLEETTMTKRNITLKSILLVVLLIIIFISLDIAKARTLTLAGLNLKTAGVRSAVHLSRFDLLGKHEPALEAVKTNVALKDAVLRVDADRGLGTQQNLLDV